MYLPKNASEVKAEYMSRASWHVLDHAWNRAWCSESIATTVLVVQHELYLGRRFGCVTPHHVFCRTARVEWGSPLQKRLLPSLSQGQQVDVFARNSFKKVDFPHIFALLLELFPL